MAALFTGRPLRGCNTRTMARHKTRKNAPASMAPTLAAALEENKGVKLRVERVATDLATAGAVLETRIAGGNPALAAHVALKVSKEVEDKVQQCADDLHAVNKSLAEGVAALEHTEDALAAAREALVETRSALSIAEAQTREALLAARHDSATGLPNREYFDARLTHDIAVAARHGLGLAVMFFDLDKFKTINDTHGHAAGDAVLKQVAARLLRNCRSEDTVCRTGGDEFLYVLIDPQGRENIEGIASALLESLARPVHFEGLEIVVRPSIGIACYPEHGILATELVGNADAAMYAAKKNRAGPGWAFCDAALAVPVA
ncbi:MAG: GGDEF domain-containing protein [Burkholderiaceae bacterium]